MTHLYIGLMSGTSLDGVDGVLVDFSAGASSPLHLRAHAHRPFAPDLAAELLALNTTGADELHRAALAANALVRVYADVVRDLLERSGVTHGEVHAIGAHGQTVRHRPREFDGLGYTLQLNNPALLAELSSIDVIADFRTRDVVAGGQGAPLVPAFHRAVFGRTDEGVAVLNIGGISNLTHLAADGSTIGFDCGPGNALMDHWCRRHTGRPFDEDGTWAGGGRVIDRLLSAMQGEVYFDLPPPKSTGRDLFNPAWLDTHLRAHGPGADPRDVQATLAELTAWACADAVSRHATGAREVLVCGGGALNISLMRRLAARLPACAVRSTSERGLDVSHVEAAAFAWLAKAFVERRPGNLVAVTGAAGPRLLGALYPAG
ncbi:anhydro-N-acetylmuramic acid kinase [Piscinibacter sp. XHJ-5]|uniref:anhydro-N-acetylmuramic acid kinase n=1 Tax=Piscinibacter sp. XHJ-5 TaxID=3037797 RepID=UPI00245326CB|nr:anhydro-N-acetylmuramic acid kinase [Piscinibacter sp. XHJ-5]